MENTSKTGQAEYSDYIRGITNFAIAVTKGRVDGFENLGKISFLLGYNDSVCEKNQITGRRLIEYNHWVMPETDIHVYSREGELYISKGEAYVFGDHRRLGFDIKESEEKKFTTIKLDPLNKNTLEFDIDCVSLNPVIDEIENGLRIRYDTTLKAKGGKSSYCYYDYNPLKWGGFNNPNTRYLIMPSKSSFDFRKPIQVLDTIIKGSSNDRDKELYRGCKDFFQQVDKMAEAHRLRGRTLEDFIEEEESTTEVQQGKKGKKHNLKRPYIKYIKKELKSPENFDRDALATTLKSLSDRNAAIIRALYGVDNNPIIYDQSRGGGEIPLTSEQYIKLIRQQLKISEKLEKTLEGLRGQRGGR